MDSLLSNGRHVVTRTDRGKIDIYSFSPSINNDGNNNNNNINANNNNTNNSNTTIPPKVFLSRKREVETKGSISEVDARYLLGETNLTSFLIDLETGLKVYSWKSGRFGDLYPDVHLFSL